MRCGLCYSVLLVFLLVAAQVSAATYIVGIVEDAADGTPADGQIVILWNPANGIADNVTDIVGPTGQSMVNNVYLIDCEALDTDCGIGDEMRVRVLDTGDGYTSEFENLTVTGAGFDVMENLTLNSPPQVNISSVDDGVFVPLGEIDLAPFSNTTVICNGTILELDGNETLLTPRGELFASTSFFGDSDDNNYHYSNTSCFLDLGYGSDTEAYFVCGFSVAYYAQAGMWNCSVQVTDSLNATRIGSNMTIVNELIALSVPGVLNFGTVDGGDVSDEVLHNVTNAGNVMINLSLSGYAQTIGDGYAMNCSTGGFIPVGYVKHNLTATNPGSLNLEGFSLVYENLTAAVVVRRFNLGFHVDDGDSLLLDSTNATYWRAYVPHGVGGSCIGNIVFGATTAQEG